jgi:hypothetical protein
MHKKYEHQLSRKESDMRSGILKVGTFIICIAALMAVQPLADSSPEEDQVIALKNWAVEYAIGQQRESNFQLDSYEEMKSADLRKLIRDPWYEKREALGNQISGMPDYDQIWNKTMAEDDQVLMQLFRENLESGRHCEAWIYLSLLWFEANQMTASNEAYQVYIEGYEDLKYGLEDEVKKAVTVFYDCLPCNGSLKSSRINRTSAGVESDPEDVAQMYAGPTGPGDWPDFPEIWTNFELIDGSEPPGDNFVKISIRNWDRTNGEILRNQLEWMVSGWDVTWSIYHQILDREGLEAAKEAFRNNLSIDSDTSYIYFSDNGTKSDMGIFRTSFGTIDMIKRKNLLRRCIPALDAE